jgi:CubicO group peptidase (beta-lactamase class C family)
MKWAITVLTIVLFCLFFGTTTGASEDPMRDGPFMNDLERQPLKKDIGEPPKPGQPLILSGDCSDYEDLTGLPLPISILGTTVGAANDYGPFSGRPDCWGGSWYSQASAGPDVTFKWTAPSDGNYMISLCDSDYDNGLMLYRFTCPEEPVYPDDFLCGNDDYCLIQSKLRDVSLSEGEEILIVVDGYGNNAGDFELSIEEIPIDDIDAYIERQMEMYHIPGAAACIVKDGQVDWTGSYGYANIEDEIEVADTSLFLLASISKTVVAVAVMQLWEDGLFDLDDDIDDYLPFSVRNPNYPMIPITFRMLMAHVSSINDNGDILGELWTWGEDSPIPLGVALEEYLTPGGDYYDDNNYHSWPPVGAYDYSSVGACLAAYLVEVINPDHHSFAEYCNENIFAPLDMNETSWFLADLNIDNIAMPYGWNGYDYVPYEHHGHAGYPSGQLRTSTLQLARHLGAFMQYGRIDEVRILDSTTVEMMTRVQYPDLNPSVGLIWRWTYSGQRLICGHNGSSWGARTEMRYCPEESNGVIVLTNIDHSNEVSYAINLMVDDLFEYAAGSGGFIAGVVSDELANPIDHAFAEVNGLTTWDYSNPDGEYYVGGLIAGSYDARFTHRDYYELIVEDISVVLGETTYVDVIMQSPCIYIAGDCDHNGTPVELSDVIAMIGMYRGTVDPYYICDCPPHGSDFAPEGDPNGNCVANELSDVITEIGAYRGTTMAMSCADCPGLRR